jgi:large subunit ribosomal protein L21
MTQLLSTLCREWCAHSLCVFGFRGASALPHTIAVRSRVVYAIIRDRGTQYRVEVGQVLEIALLDAEPGSQVEFGEVLLVGGDTTQVGAPALDGVKVLADVVDDIKGEKIVVFKYKNKKRYRRRTGHRQQYTRVKISDIQGA